MYDKKLINLFSEDDFLSDLFKLRKPKDVEEFFKSKGVVLTIEELEEMCDIIEVCTAYGGNLPDSELDQAVGGISSKTIKQLLKNNMKSINKIISNINISSNSFWITGN